MTNKKGTKRALLMSVLAMMMSVSMLVGSTFAWFTDSVTSGSNVITSGNLDIEVTYTLGDTDSNGDYIWNNLDGAKDLFQKGLWEPGHTEVVVLRIENKGSLAAKYEAQMNIVSETYGKNKDGNDIILSDILTVETNVVAEDKQFASNNDTALYVAFNWEDMEWLSTPVPFKSDRILNVARANAGVNDAECTMLLSGEAHYVVVMVDMDETVGNEANHDGENVPTINFGINVLATQYAYEYDTFGNQYDAGATYPVVDAKGLADAITAGNPVKLEANVSLVDTINVASDVYIDLNGYELDASENASRPFNVTDGANLTIDAEGAEIECGAYGLVSMTEGTLTINGGTFTNDEGNNGSFIRVSGDEEMEINLNGVTYNAGTVDSGVIRTSGSNVTVNVVGGTYEAGMGFLIENGSITGATISATNTANMWPAVYADGNVTVSGCTIKSACHAIAVGGGNTVTVENCDVQAGSDKLAFQVFSSGGTINVVNCTYTGQYGTTGKINSGCPDAVIIIDGVEVYRKSAQ